MSCTFDWRPSGVVKTFEGFVAGSDFVKSAQLVAEDPRFDDVRFIVNDLLRITGHSIDADAYSSVAVSRLGAMRTNPNFRVIFVVSATLVDELSIVFNLSRLSAPFDPVLVTSLEDCWTWLQAQPVLSAYRRAPPGRGSTDEAS